MKIYYENDHGILFHGDCLEVMSLLNESGVKVDMVLCDPPYGTTQNKWDSRIPFESMWSHIRGIVKPETPIIFTAQAPFTYALAMSNIKEFKYQWVWEKSQATGFLNAKKMPLKNYEDVLVFYRRLPTYNPQFTEGKPYVAKSNASKNKGNYGKFNDNVTINEGYRYPKSIIKFSNGRKVEHPTQKPIGLFAYLISTYTNVGESILDFCAGSGTTAIAAERLGRKWILIEKEKKYCEIIKQRLEDMNNNG